MLWSEALLSVVGSRLTPKFLSELHPQWEAQGTNSSLPWPFSWHRRGMVKGVGNEDSTLRFLPNLLSVVSLSVQPTTRWADMSHSGNAQRLNSLLPSVPLGVEKHQKYFPRLGSEFTHLTWWIAALLPGSNPHSRFFYTDILKGLYIPEIDINQERNQESCKRGIKVFFQRHI